MLKYLIIVLIQVFLLAKVESSTNSHGVNTNSIGGVDNSIQTEFKVSNYDLTNAPVPVSSQQARQMNNIIGQNQIRSNQVGTGLIHKAQTSFDNNRFRDFARSFTNKFFGQDINHRERGFLTRPRTVESPAYSVDSGGHSSGSIAGELAKLLDIKQGYYADIYDKIDRPAATTKKPADAIEDKIKTAVERFLAKRFHRHNVKQNKIAYN